MKIKSKIILFLIAPIFVTDIVVSLINGIENYDSLKLLSEEKFQAQTANIAAKIARENEGGISVARTAATAAQIWFGERAKSATYIKDLLQIFPSFVGASIGYEVNADFNDFRSECGIRNLRDGKDVTADEAVDSYDFKNNPTAVSYDEWLAKSEGGRFAAYWNRSKGDLTLEPLVGMGTSMYSAGLKKKLDSGDAERYIVTEPYLYNNKVLMVEYSAPIFNENRFVGQVAFDKDLTNISNTVLSLKTVPTAEIFLLSSQARVIACTKNQNIKTVLISDLFTDEAGAFMMSFLRDENGRLLRDDSANIDTNKLGTMYRDLLASAFDTAKGAGILTDASQGVSYFKDPKTKKSYCVAQALVRPGNWVLVQIIPEYDLLTPVYESVKKEAIGAGVFFVIIFIAMLFANAMLRRVGRATSMARQIAQGNLDIDIHSSDPTNDETDMLLAAMSDMAHKLRSQVRFMEESGMHVENSAFNMERASSNCENGVRAFEQSALSISQSVRNIGDATQELRKSSDALHANAGDASDLAESGRRNLVEMGELVNKLSRDTGIVSRRFSIISERAANINSVVTAVSKVADETNLLSLNASIEAEKAGSYGVGFSVVAREIGRLADQTAVATSDIDSIVKEMKNAVDAGVVEMENFADGMSVAVDEMTRLALIMDNVITKMQAVAPQIETLSNAIVSQRESVSEITSGIANFDAEIAQTSELIKQAAESRLRLRESVVKMRAEIGNFKLNDNHRE